VVDENRAAGVAKRALARRHGKEVYRASEVLALGADRLRRGVAQINKRRLLGPELIPKQEYGLQAFFFLRGASTDDIVDVQLCSSSTTWGSAAAS